MFEARESAPRTQEDLLRDFLGVACRQAEPAQRRVDRLGVRADEYGERVLVARSRTRDELLLGG